MGANFDSAFIPDPELKMSNTELQEKAEAIYQESAYISGHGGYSGTLAEKTGEGVTVHRSKVCETIGEAWRIMEELDSDKWGPADCVPVKDKGWAIGGMCSS